MYKKRKILLTGLAVVLLSMVLLPFAQWMDQNLAHEEQTAEVVVRPILEICDEVQKQKAEEGIPVGGWIDLEEAWAIEDVREESELPLVTVMVNGDAQLGYDKRENTFYCTLGLETGEEWPELELKAKNAPSELVIRLVDDYTYDWCDEAIREGWRYELMAYTDTHYSYFGIVFTGLPIVSLRVGEDVQISGEYMPARASVSAAGYDAIDSAAMVHIRGGTKDERNRDLTRKDSYRLEFQTIDKHGRNDQMDMAVLGMVPDSDWLLIGNEMDVTGVRNHLCWDLWSRWNQADPASVTLESRLVELFIDGQYEGIYQMMQRIDPEKFLRDMGGNPDTDYVFRVVRIYNTDETRPYKDYRTETKFLLELRQKPEHISEDKAFEMIRDYVTANRVNDETDEQTYVDIMANSFDIESLMNYFLFLQVADLGEDNVHNNLYIWVIREEDGRYAYHLTPWDLDRGLSSSYSGGGASNDKIDHSLVAARRLLNMDALGSRELIWDIWNEKYEKILNDDAIYAWIVGIEEEVNSSGAYLRDSERWLGEAQTLNMAHFSANEIAHVGAVGYYLKELWPTHDGDYSENGQNN